MGLLNDFSPGGSAINLAADTTFNSPVGVYVGTRGGEVYASADEGESFTQVAGHLPDVLSVRAAVLP